MKNKVIISLSAITGIVLLACVAIIKGIDGVLLMSALSVIAGIAGFVAAKKI